MLAFIVFGGLIYVAFCVGVGSMFYHGLGESKD